MSLRFILGRAGSGKSKFCLEEIGAQLKENPSGAALIYLVPEQAAFQADYALATIPGLGGVIRAQAFSFRRLAWKLMQELGGGRRLYIDDTGKEMLLRKVLDKQKRRLKVFKHAGEQEGALQSLVALYNELKRSRVSVTQLAEVSSEEEKGKGRSLLQDKISDLALIFQGLNEGLEGHYLDAEDYLTFLADAIFRSSFLEEAEIWVDGFYGFTEQEHLVLERLFKRCRRVSVALCLGQEYICMESIDDLDLFYPTALTYQKLQKSASDSGAFVEEAVILPLEGVCSSEHTALSYLERNLYVYPAKPFHKSEDRSPLRLIAASSRRAEVETLAREIIRLARDESCRWRDMVVIVSDPDQYRDSLSTVFDDHDIPFFLDQKRPVQHHPLVEFIRSALEVINRNWCYESFFRCVKTEFLFPIDEEKVEGKSWREQAFLLENYVLAFGIHGSAWFRKENWSYRSKDDLDGGRPGNGGEKAYLELINKTRRVISKPLIRFQKEMKSSETVKEKTKVLHSLLLEVSAAERLEGWCEKALQQGNPAKAKEHLQVYKGIVALMDQVVELMGEEKFSTSVYARIFEAGLTSLRLALVPPSLDQVLVGDLTRSRMGKVKFAFILGATDGLFPPHIREDGVFLEEERQFLAEQGVALSSGGNRRLPDERFLIYMALTRASSGLWISYPLADEEGRGLMPALLVAHLKEIYPFLKEKLVTTGYDGQDIAHPHQTFSHLAVQLGQARKGMEIPSFWWDVYNWYAGKKEWREQGRRVLKGLFYRNVEDALAEETSRELYGQRVQVSVSRIERYNTCPFSQFISYGLRLQERKTYRVEALDIGRLLHAALYRVALSIQEKGARWGSLSRQECLSVAEAEVERLIPRLQEQILLSSGRYRYLAQKLKDTIGSTVVALGEQDRQSEFIPVGLEFAFGDGGNLPAVSFMSGNNFSIELVGRIDRVDLARGEDNRAYLRIIDYKLGRADLSLVNIYHGLTLQMMLYLDLVLTGAPEWLEEEALPAGVLYFRIHHPLIRVGKAIPTEQAVQRLRKEYKMRGIVLGEQEVVRLMDTGLQKGHSEIIPVAISKEGAFYKSASVLGVEHFSGLREHVRRIIRQSAAGIVAGDVAIAPYRLGKKKACTYCPYKSVCQFDLLLESNRFKVLKNVTKDHILFCLESGEYEKGGWGTDG